MLRSCERISTPIALLDRPCRNSHSVSTDWSRFQVSGCRMRPIPGKSVRAAQLPIATTNSRHRLSRRIDHVIRAAFYRYDSDGHQLLASGLFDFLRFGLFSPFFPVRSSRRITPLARLPSHRCRPFGDSCLRSGNRKALRVSRA